MLFSIKVSSEAPADVEVNQMESPNFISESIIFHLIVQLFDKKFLSQRSK